MTNLMWFGEEDDLNAMLLEPVDNWQLASPTLEEETALLGEPKEAQATAACPPWHEEQAPKPKNVAKLREAVIEPWGTEVCLPPPGFESPLPEPDVPLIGIPNLDEAQSVLMPVSTMSVVVYKNEVMGNLEYEYKIHYPEPLCPGPPDHGPKITNL